jgi:transcriptional regulator with XRE-family HTH domain
MEDDGRRNALADFLRTRRARITPAEVGLPEGYRRRTPGLRREEVAQLAHIGISWYTALEQGRDIQPSEQVLGSLAQALRLTRAERQHLYTLARLPLPVNSAPPAEQAGPALERMVQSLHPHPAYIMGRRWDLLLWNEAAEAVFDLAHIAKPHTRNLIWRAFTTPRLMENSNWLFIAQGLAAQFRADYALYPGDSSFEELIHDLQQASREFNQFWSQHDVIELPDCHKQINHPVYGHLEFDYVTLQAGADAALKLIVYTGTPATVSKLEQILAMAER